MPTLATLARCLFAVAGFLAAGLGLVSTDPVLVAVCWGTVALAIYAVTMIDV